MKNEKKYYIVFYHVERVYSVRGEKLTAHYIRQKTFHDLERAISWCSRNCTIGYSIVQVSLSNYSLVCTEVERVGGL